MHLVITFERLALNSSGTPYWSRLSSYWFEATTSQYDAVEDAIGFFQEERKVNDWREWADRYSCRYAS